MDYHNRRRIPSSSTAAPRGGSWCCSFTHPPKSPENPSFSRRNHHCNKAQFHQKPDSLYKLTSNSVPSSPHSSKSGLSLVGRILSPGRVSPIDHHESAVENPPVPVDAVTRSRSESFRAKRDDPERPRRSYPGQEEAFDTRLNLKGRSGGVLLLELNSSVLAANSEVFAGLIAASPAKKVHRIEVSDIDNLGIFRETIELMFEGDVTKKLVKIGIYRAVDILEVSAGIMFNKGVLSCLKYLEAVPWTEEEEEKLRSLFARYKFDDATTKDILARLYPNDSADSEHDLAKQLVSSITSCTDANARNELKPLVKGLLCKSSVYEKEQPDVSKEDLYSSCRSCVSSLICLFEEATDVIPQEKLNKSEMAKPLIERICRQVDNINWLLEIMLDRQIAEEFVGFWSTQQALLKMHENTSPMVRYELSRVSALLIIAMGTRKLHCCSETRSGLLQSWFSPMLLDFGWLQRCRKGLNMRVLEEATGQALLALPRKQQYTLFMEWFRCFSRNGTDCPNLSKAFQIWWRRTFLRGSESHAIESR